jgi:hypothetical protein
MDDIIRCRNFDLQFEKKYLKNIIKYIITLLPTALYGCQTWSLTLREEGKEKVFKNRVFRGIFEPRRDEIRGEWRKLHNEELLTQFVRLIKSKISKYAEHVPGLGEYRRYIQGFGVNRRGKETNWETQT